MEALLPKEEVFFLAVVFLFVCLHCYSLGKKVEPSVRLAGQKQGI